MKVKFKFHEKAKGLMRVASGRRGCDIIFGKNKIGSMTDDGAFNIRLMILKADIMEDGNENCKWKWVTLKKKFSNLDDAKDFVRENWNNINKYFDIYYGE